MFRNYHEFVEQIRENQLADVEVILRNAPELLISFQPVYERPLIIAAKHGLNDMIELFVSIDPTIIDLPSNKGYTALHIASKKGHASAVELLIRFGIKAIDEFGGPLSRLETPMFLAVKNQHLNVIEMLMQNGCVSIDKPCGKITPLAYAASKGFVDVARTLVRLGSKSLNTLIFGESTMHFAVRGGHAPMVRLLAELGSTALNTINYRGYRLMTIAISRNSSSELIETLYCLGEIADDRSMKVAMHSNNETTVCTFIELGLCHVDGFPGYRSTYLNKSTRCCLSRITELLIALGGSGIGKTVPIMRALTTEKIGRELTEDRRAELRFRVYFQRSLTNRLLLEEARSHAILHRPCQRQLTN